MPLFTVIEPLEHDATRYEPQAEVTLGDETAAPLLAIGHIVPALAKAAASVATAAGRRKAEPKAGS